MLESTRLFAAKFSAPSLPSDMLRRTSLLRKIESSNANVIAVVAHAGSGKSTLLSDYYSKLLEHKKKASWLRLDPYDNGIAFWLYFAQALNRIDENQDFTWIESIENEHGSELTWINKLINQLENINCEFTIILDDFQNIKLKDIHVLLQRIIMYMPNNMHLVFSSREEIPLQFARLRLQNKLLEISGEDLSFTFEETESYLYKNNCIPTETESALNVFDETQGWVAGVKVIALAFKNNAPDNILNALSGHVKNDDIDSLFGYFAEEMLSSLDEPCKFFLLKTSFLKDINSALCNCVLKINNAQELLERIEKQNLFISTAKDSKYTWYQMHPLFRKYLYGQYQQSAHQKIHEQHCCLAAKWLDDNGYTELSLPYYLQGKKYTRILEHFDNLYEQKAFHSELSVPIITLFSKIPAKYISKFPRCMVMYVIALFHLGNCEEINTFFKDEYSDFLNGKFEDEDEYLTRDYYIVHALKCYANNDFQAAINLMQNAFRLHCHASYSANGLLMLLASRCYLALGEIDKAISMLRSSIDNARQHQMVEEALISSRELARVYASVGYIHQADSEIQNALKYAKKNSFEGTIVDFLRFASSLAYREWGDSKPFNELLNQKQEFIAQQKQHFDGWLHSPDFLLELSRCYCSLGDYEQAANYFHSAKDLLKQYLNIPLLPEQVTYYRLKFWLLSDNQDRINTWANARKKRPYTSTDAAKKLRTVTDGMILMSRDEPKEAIDLFEKELPNDKDIILLSFRIDYHFIKAWAHMRLNGFDYAIPHVLSALKRGFSCGCIQHFSEWGPWIIPLLEAIYNNIDNDANENYEFKEYINQVITFVKDCYKDGNLGPLWQQNLISQNAVQFTKREKEILKLLVDGQSAKNMAAELGVSASTVTSHINRIYKKLDAHNRIEAAIKAKKILKL